MNLNKLLFAFLMTSIPLVASAEVTIRPIAYDDGGTAMQGSLLTDSSWKNKRPVVLVFPDWMGPSPVTEDAARQVVAAGYAAFIVDVYGKAVRPQSPKEAGEVSGSYKANRPLLRQRGEAALKAVAKLQEVDHSKVAAMGFCFGGTAALELARNGAPLLGTISFHGGLETPDATEAKNIKGKILALHGADDPLVPEKDVAAFEAEMRSAKIDWELVKFGGAVHAFTNKQADQLHFPGVAYNAAADKRSFQLMKLFFAEIFGM